MWGKKVWESVWEAKDLHILSIQVDIGEQPQASPALEFHTPQIIPKVIKRRHITKMPH